MVQFSTNDDSLDAPRERPCDAQPKAFPGDPHREVFSVQSATLMLPLIQRIVLDLITLAKELKQQAAQIRGLERLPKPTNLIAFAEELAAIKESFSTDRQRLESCQRELLSLGVKIDSLEDGIIDFPAMIDRRPVMLCWKVGEPKVTHWHGAEEGFSQRSEIIDDCIDTVPTVIAQRP